MDSNYIHVHCSLSLVHSHSCIREDWKGTKVDSTGVDFNQLEDAFREKVCTCVCMPLIIPCVLVHGHATIDL